MRRLMLATLIASFLAGCGAAPTVPQRMAARPAKQPVVRVIPGVQGPAPTVTVTANADAKSVAKSQESVDELLAADSSMDAIELLIQDGGAYFVQGWFTDLKDAIKRVWTRWKLSREVKAALKKNREMAAKIHSGAIDSHRENRVGLKTKVNDLGEGLKEIVQTWKSTNQGTFDIETRRTIDEDGVTQASTVSVEGKNKKGLGVELSRVRSLKGEDGTYEVATKLTTTYKDGRKDDQEWLKVVRADGTETITGFIDHRDGYRTEITGTRDAKGKVKVDVEKIRPGDKS